MVFTKNYAQKQERRPPNIVVNHEEFKVAKKVLMPEPVDLSHSSSSSLPLHSSLSVPRDWERFVGETKEGYKSAAESFETLHTMLERNKGSLSDQVVRLDRGMRTQSKSKWEALCHTFTAVKSLKHSGSLASILKSPAITDAMITRMEQTGLDKPTLKMVGKWARLELLRLVLFNAPPYDRDFGCLLASDLIQKFGCDQAQIDSEDEHRYALDLTLRQRHHRQANALRAIMAELDQRHGFLGPNLSERDRLLLEHCVRRLGVCGDRKALPRLTRISALSKDLRIKEAVALAKKEIERAAHLSIVFAAMEAKPYCSAGGISNVMAELPKALAKMGHQVTVILPRHHCVDRSKLIPVERKIGTVYSPGPSERFELYTDRNEGVDYYFIENDRFFSGSHREGIYGNARGDYPDGAKRYDFFALTLPTAIRMVMGSKTPDLVQLNDAHVGSAAVYLKNEHAFDKTAVVMAVHNLGAAYQGRFNQERHLPEMAFNGLNYAGRGSKSELNGEINLMKLGLTVSDAAITVSREYAREILQEERGEGLDGTLQHLYKNGRLWGNLNGIDNRAWNPETDQTLPARFSLQNRAGKSICKAELQDRFDLVRDPEAPLVGIVARLTEQKGFDDILESLEYLMKSATPVQFVICGTGDAALANRLMALSKKYKGWVGFDNQFASWKEHLIYAGSDLFLMPSKFEPCGLPQMYALRYLSVPIVRAVGGLKESITDYNEHLGSGNGFTFGPKQNCRTIHEAMDRALSWYGEGEKQREALIKNCALCDFSWENNSAPEQLAFYREVIGRSVKGVQR